MIAPGLDWNFDHELNRGAECCDLVTQSNSVGLGTRNPDVYLHHRKRNPSISHPQKRDADSHADATKGFPNLKVLRPVGRSPVVAGVPLPVRQAHPVVDLLPRKPPGACLPCPWRSAGLDKPGTLGGNVTTRQAARLFPRWVTLGSRARRPCPGDCRPLALIPLPPGTASGCRWSGKGSHRLITGALSGVFHHRPPGALLDIRHDHVKMGLACPPHIEAAGWRATIRMRRRGTCCPLPRAVPVGRHHRVVRYSAYRTLLVTIVVLR